MVLNLFYEEPNPDRWLPFDRYPRKLIRRLIRGKPPIGGQRRLFLNLLAGLKRIGVSFRVNDYHYISSHPQDLACIVGKPHVLRKISWPNPILFGPAAYSHPSDDPTLLERFDIRTLLVPGEWMRIMVEPYYRKKAVTWPVGIDTDKWLPRPNLPKTTDFLVYDKVMWHHDRLETQLLQPIRNELRQSRLSFKEIRYGFYKEEAFERLLQNSKAMLFLCEHETQGIAYQQALACGVPILAWDQAGFWQDPTYYPHEVKFSPVSSVPYWDSRCGAKFANLAEFRERLPDFRFKLSAHAFVPRDFILENLTLEKCARTYVRIASQASGSPPLV